MNKTVYHSSTLILVLPVPNPVGTQQLRGCVAGFDSARLNVLLKTSSDGSHRDPREWER